MSVNDQFLRFPFEDVPVVPRARSAKVAAWSRGIHVADPEGTMRLGRFAGRVWLVQLKAGTYHDLTCSTGG